MDIAADVFEKLLFNVPFKMEPEINTSLGDLKSELAVEKSSSIFGYSFLKNSLICPL